MTDNMGCKKRTFDSLTGFAGFAAGLHCPFRQIEPYFRYDQVARLLSQILLLFGKIEEAYREASVLSYHYHKVFSPRSRQLRVNSATGESRSE